MSAW
jgi:transposase